MTRDPLMLNLRLLGVATRRDPLMLGAAVLGHAERAREHGRLQAVLGRVGKFDRLGQRSVLHDDRDRAEDLLAGNVLLRPNIGQDRRLELSPRAPASDDDGGTVIDGGMNPRLDADGRGLVDQGSDLGFGVQRIADAEVASARAQ
ncbi:hypothetical protein BH24ACT7_BH24ACT7_23930 [soil metagenome]